MQRLKRLPRTKQEANKIPETPGIYIFWSKSKKVNYIGKAINLRKRVNSYFAKTLLEKTSLMLNASTHFSVLRVTSELEALVLEAKLIQKYKPKYNIDLKDDKHPLYICITKEKYPRVLLARKRDIKSNDVYYGPFPSSGKLHSVLALLRKAFPYAEHLPEKRRCIYAHLGLCNPCPSEIEKLNDKSLREEYMKNIRNIRGTLNGRITTVKNRLYREMSDAARKKKFEEAALIRDKIEHLEYITQPIFPVKGFIDNPNLIEDIRANELRQLKEILIESGVIIDELTRIECYDVAHLAGSSPTASMVTFIAGVADKSLYRRYKIQQAKRRSDTDSLLEVASRRAKRLADWGVPDLLLIDGGKGQVSAFNKIFRKENIPVIGIAKRYETLIISTKEGFSSVRLVRGPALNLVQRLRDEAHRFARSYHHTLVSRELLKTL